MPASAESNSNQDNEGDQGDSFHPHHEDEAAVDGDDTNDRAQETLGYLARLDTEYQSLSEKETALLQAQARLQREEASLADALSLAEDHSKPPQRPRKNEDEAALRLEDALMGANNATDDDESTKMSGAAFSLGSFMDKSLPSLKRDDDDNDDEHTAT